MIKWPLSKLFFRDISYSFSYGKYKYASFYSLIALLALMISLQIKPLGSNSIGTFFLLLQDKGYIRVLADYQVPLNWDFIQFFSLFLIGDFLFQDQENNRTYLLLRCRSKCHFILSRIFWIVVQNVFLYLGIIVVIYVVSSLTLGDFSIGESAYFNHNIASLMAIKVSPEQLLLRILLGFIMTSIVLSSIQLLCIQFISPTITFFGVVVISSISTFYGNKWLPAIHSMILKQDIFNLEHHLTLNFSITYCAVLYVIVTVLTIFVFKNKDIL